jgi:DNA ligase (NAD+)
MSEAYEDQYIAYLAKTLNQNRNNIIKLIDDCIRKTAKTLNLDYSDVYASIHSLQFMSVCLKDKCSQLTLEKCNESCFCVNFQGKCYPRFFADANIMNEDPDKYLIGMPTDKLMELVKLASYLYYNYEGGGITDNTFDAFEYTLNKRLKIKGRRYEKIGAEPVEKIRVKLPYAMPSLDKVKPGSRELLNFLDTVRSQKTPLWWSSKLDGVSAMLVYVNGVLKEMYTRGDGQIGGDVTYLKGIINVPETLNNKHTLVIRGEFIISKSKWEKYNLSYTNPRAFVSAKINSGFLSTGLNDIDFVAYYIIDTSNVPELTNKLDQQLHRLKQWGFNVVDNGLMDEFTVFDLIVLYESQRKKSMYNIDGLVIGGNILTFEDNINKNPRNRVAFKMKLQEQIRHSRVINVEWNVTRYGRMVPVCIFETVYVDGVRMHRASAFNAAHVKDWSLGKGTAIKVIRSGDVIPTILDVDTDRGIKPLYPHPIAPGALGLDKGWHWSRSDIVVNDIDNNRNVQLRRSYHFFKTLGVSRLGEKTLEKLWDSGMRSIKAITNAKASDFIKIKGIGKKLADTLYENIHTTMRKTRLDRYIPASTTLQLGIGRKLIKQLLNYHPTLMNDSPATLATMLLKKEIPGIGKKRIKNIVDNITKFKEFLYSLNKDDLEFAIKHDQERISNIMTRGYNNKIRGKTFIFTGFYGKIDYDLEDYIYDNFGSLGTTVDVNTETVVSANLVDVTNKMLTAEKYGVKVLSIEEFITNYDIKLTSGDYAKNNDYDESAYIDYCETNDE